MDDKCQLQRHSPLRTTTNMVIRITYFRAIRISFVVFTSFLNVKINSPSNLRKGLETKDFNIHGFFQ